MEVLKVSSKTQVAKLAGAIASFIREEGKVELQAVGAGAINQAVKAVAVARGFVIASGLELVLIPSFSIIEVDGEEKTAIEFVVEPRR